jgi:hypothetical protein
MAFQDCFLGVLGFAQASTCGHGFLILRVYFTLSFHFYSCSSVELYRAEDALLLRVPHLYHETSGWLEGPTVRP